MDPITLAMLASIGIGVGQLAAGSNALSDADRPTREVPESLRRTQALSEMLAADPKFAGYDLAKEESEMAAANQLRAASEMGNSSETIGQVGGQIQESMRRLAQLNQQDQRQDIGQLSNVMSQVAQEENINWQYNEFAPYAEQVQRGEDMVGAGLENVVGGIAGYGLAGGEFPFGSMADMSSATSESGSLADGLLGAGQGAAGVGAGVAGATPSERNGVLDMANNILGFVTDPNNLPGNEPEQLDFTGMDFISGLGDVNPDGSPNVDILLQQYAGFTPEMIAQMTEDRKMEIARKLLQSY
jgi:hypothetical protein